MPASGVESTPSAYAFDTGRMPGGWPGFVIGRPGRT